MIQLWFLYNIYIITINYISMIHRNHYSYNIIQKNNLKII